MFSGNFWWANCDHVAALPSLPHRFDAYAVEYFIFNVSHHFMEKLTFGQNCGYSTYKCKGVNHYDQECPAERYKPLLLRYVSEIELPGNAVASISRSTDWVKSNCGGFRDTAGSGGRGGKGGYVNQPGWDHHEQFPIRVHGTALSPLDP